MQTKSQARSRNWKVVASVAAASALGLTGVAVATSDGAPSEPDPIRLEDTTTTTVAEVSSPSSVPTTVADALRLGADTASANSPQVRDQVSPVSAQSPQDKSPASAASPTSPQSPQTPQSPVSPVSAESPAEQVSAASPVSAQSPASPASAASPVSAQSPASADSSD